MDGFQLLLTVLKSEEKMQSKLVHKLRAQQWLLIYPYNNDYSYILIIKKRSWSESVYCFSAEFAFDGVVLLREIGIVYCSTLLSTWCFWYEVGSSVSLITCYLWSHSARSLRSRQRDNWFNRHILFLVWKKKWLIFIGIIKYFIFLYSIPF